MTNDPSLHPNDESRAASHRRTGRSAVLLWLLLLLAYLAGYTFIRFNSRDAVLHGIDDKEYTFLPPWQCLDSGQPLDRLYTPLYNAEAILFRTHFVKVDRGPFFHTPPPSPATPDPVPPGP